MAEPEQAGVMASPGRESRADSAAVILTPDQRVRVFSAPQAPTLVDGPAHARPRSKAWLLPPDGRVFPGYTVSQVLAPCRPWQRPPRPAG
jgi:hypothetical protein